MRKRRRRQVPVDAHASPFSRTSRAFLGYLALAFFFYLPHVIGLVRFPDGDFTEHFVPFAYFLAESVRSGYFPVWNPYTYGGHPFLADVQAAVFYPPQLAIVLLTLPWNTPGVRAYTLELEVVLHTALAGFGVYLLVRSLLRDPHAAFIAGVIFAFSGFLTGYPPLQTAVLRTAVWLPYACWGVFEAWEGKAWGWWAAAAAVALAFFGGHPQTFLFLAYITAAWLLVLGWLRQERRLAWIGGAASLLAVTLGLTAAQWLPSLEFMRYSVRAHLTYEEAAGGFPIRDTWQFLFPNVLTLYSPLYVGIAGLGLAFVALVGGLRRGPKARPWALKPQQGIVFYALVGLVFLLTSYGKHGFLYPVAYRYLPGWNLFRGQERAAYGVAFALSVLAGYGSALLSTWPALWRRRFALSTVAAVALAMGVFTATVRDLPTQAVVRSAGLTLLLAVGFAAVLWRWGRLAPWALLGLVLLDLFLVNAQHNRVPGAAWSVDLVPPEAERIQQALRGPRPTLQRMPGRVHNEYRIYADYGMIAGVEELWGSSPLRLARFDRLFRDFPQSRLWDLFGVEYVLTWRREMFEPAVLVGQFPGDRTPDHAPSYLHRLLTPNPRARVVARVEVADDDTTWQKLADFSVNLDEVAFVSPEFASVVEAIPENGKGRPVWDWQRLAPNRLSVRVDTPTGGFLVVAENWLPGWRARAQGPDGTVRELPVVRANLTLIGVVVPAGAWTVEFTYWPDSVRVGLFVSAFSLLVWLAWGWHTWRR